MPDASFSVAVPALNRKGFVMKRAAIVAISVFVIAASLYAAREVGPVEKLGLKPESGAYFPAPEGARFIEVPNGSFEEVTPFGGYGWRNYDEPGVSRINDPAGAYDGDLSTSFKRRRVVSDQSC